MTAAFATVATGSYLALLPTFLRALRLCHPRTDLFVLTVASDHDAARSILESLNLGSATHLVSAETPLGIPPDEASIACALKLRVWSHLPTGLTTMTFMDVDTILIGNLEGALRTVRPAAQPLALARDSYVGYKERMAGDFAILGDRWVPHFDGAGRRLYCNTGLMWSSRSDAPFFEAALNCWRTYAALTGSSPPLWDQGILNYCLDIGTYGRRWEDVTVLDERFNVLKEYDVTIDLDRGFIALGEQPVVLLHFNGGTALEKYARRARALPALLWRGSV